MKDSDGITPMTKDKKKTWLDDLDLTKLEPAIFTAIITSCLYFFGYGYLSYYYGKLSISLKLIDFQLSDYLLAGLIPILFVLFIIILSFFIWKQKFESQTLRRHTQPQQSCGA